MSEYGSLVEREMQRIAPATFSLEDLRTRRERRRRNQRIAAGAVALVIGAVPVGLGLMSVRGVSPDDERPAGPDPGVSSLTREDLDAIVLGPEEAPADTRHIGTDQGEQAVAEPLTQASQLSVRDLTGPGTRFVEARTERFLKGLEGLPDSLFFASVGVLYEDAQSAERAWRLLVGDFLGRDEDATQKPTPPSLGEDAALVRGAFLGGPEPVVVYIWRTGNVVLIAAGAPGIAEDFPGVPREVRSIAAEMNARALDAAAA